MMRFLIGLLVFVALLWGAGTLLMRGATKEDRAPTAIEGAADGMAFWDESFSPTPVAGSFRQHPGLAARGGSTMHSDSYQSDVHPVVGPMGDSFEIKTRKAGGKLQSMCPTYLFPKNGKLIVMCGGLFGFNVKLFEPDTLEMLADYRLPMRPSAFQALIKRDPSLSFEDSSGGAYLVLDKEDRVLLADSRQIIHRIKIVENEDGTFELIQEKSWNMRKHVPNDCQHYNNWFPRGECDMLTTVVPDYEGRYWWVSRYGRVGTLDPDTGAVSAMKLDGEEVQNSVAVDERGVYILSDHAMYLFAAGADNKPEIVWREEYDRGTSRKVGSINQGSGTTPTLLGDEYMTFADNADGRINLVVLRRGALAADEERRICTVPLFAEGKSATDNSIIAIGRSILIENNYGYTNGFIHEDWDDIEGGVARIDVREDESGCDVAWTSDLVVPSVVPKMSSENGIAYFYSFEEFGDGEQLWSLVGLNFETGEQVLKVPTGIGSGFNNNWAAITLAPEGVAYVGSMGGTIQIRPVSR